jgi:hypothetical protein
MAFITLAVLVGYDLTPEIRFRLPVARHSGMHRVAASLGASMRPERRTQKEQEFVRSEYQGLNSPHLAEISDTLPAVFTINSAT